MSHGEKEIVSAISKLKARSGEMQAVFERCITEALKNSDFAKLQSIFFILQEQNCYQ